jgi:hypothetical protein
MDTRSVVTSLKLSCSLIALIEANPAAKVSRSTATR